MYTNVQQADRQAYESIAVRTTTAVSDRTDAARLPVRCRRTAAGKYGIKNLYDVSSRPAWYSSSSSSSSSSSGRGSNTEDVRLHGSHCRDEYVNMTPMC